jgi:bifunctional DNase/RNase
VEKIKLEILGLSASQAQSNSFALVLGEEGHRRRRLPVIIGMFEAQAIAIEIEKIVSHRPMTHDLFRSFAQAFEYTVEEVIIAELKEGVFFAKILCSNNKGFKKIEIDARPSDAIAIGLRFNAPIYTYESVLSEAGIDMGEEEATITTKESTPTKNIKAGEPTMAEMSKEDLQKLLDKALADEDYEKAAQIRDELNKKK